LERPGIAGEPPARKFGRIMAIQGILGRKLGMVTHYRDDGTAEAVTAIQVGPCTVTQIKTVPRDGYEAVQIGFENAKRLNKPLSGHLERSGGMFKHLTEFAATDLGEYEVGQTVDASIFDQGETVTVISRSKGRGFAGGVRRHHFRGGPKTHGQSDRHRAPGSIGAGSSPGRVWKGTKMAGHMGDRRVSQRGLMVVAADAERSLILVRGSVPGARNALVRIEKPRTGEKGGG